MKKILFLVLINITCLFSLNAQIPHQENCATCKKVIVRGGTGENRCQHDGKHPKCGECGKIIDKGHKVENRCKYDGKHPPYLNVDSKEIIVNGKKSETFIGVSSNVKWSAQASNTWISINKQNGGLNCTIQRNPQNTTREGFVDIYTSDRSKSVRMKVIQLKNMGVEIKSIQFANSKDSLLSKYGDTLYASDIFFLCARMNYKSLMTTCDHDDTLFVKIIKPDGTLSNSIKHSPNGYTFCQKNISFHYQSSEWCSLSGWGSKSGGSYSPGTYTYEIWYHDGLVYSTKFTLYDKKTTSGGVRMDGNTLVFSVDGTEYRYEMVYVSGGTFKMGAQKDDPYSDNYYPDASIESPVHNVTVNSFHMGQTEVTQALWKTVMESEPSYNGGWSNEYGRGDSYPAYWLSWDDCQVFIKKLNQLTGKMFRLPTEAEWEYSARGGNKSRDYKYAGSNTIGDVTWYIDNSSSSTHPVKGKLRNELGLYDMSGNVWEWCQDWYGNYSSSSQTDPKGPSSGSDRVLRGGSWRSRSEHCRVSDRIYNSPSYRGIIGFRLCLDQ